MLCLWVLEIDGAAKESSATDIVAIPIRRALGLHRSASVLHACWDVGIPDIATLRTKCILQSTSRAFRSARAGNLLPQLLVDDLEAFNELAVSQTSNSAFYNRPFVSEVKEIQQRFPTLVPQFPLEKKQIASCQH